MLQIVRSTRYYCQSVIKRNVIPTSLTPSNKKKPLDFKKVHHPTKVPLRPVVQEFPTAPLDEIEIDAKTIQLLERLSLVDLGSKEALETLKSSIQFAKKIENIDTTSVPPLYTVLENQNLQLREDKITDGNYREEILHNAKVTEEDYFVSPPGNIPLQQEEKNLK